MQKTCVYKIIVLSLHRKNKTIILNTMKNQVANNSFRSKVFKEAHRLYNELRPRVSHLCKCFKGCLAKLPIKTP